MLCKNLFYLVLRKYSIQVLFPCSRQVIATLMFTDAQAPNSKFLANALVSSQLDFYISLLAFKSFPLALGYSLSLQFKRELITDKTEKKIWWTSISREKLYTYTSPTFRITLHFHTRTSSVISFRKHPNAQLFNSSFPHFLYLPLIHTLNPGLWT